MLKTIKNRLRSPIRENNLEDLMIISYENDVTINYDEIINNFSKYSQHLFNTSHLKKKFYHTLYIELKFNCKFSFTEC